MGFGAIFAYMGEMLGVCFTQTGNIFMKKGMHKTEATGLNGGKK